MGSDRILFLFIFTLIVTTVMCQTFQYSHGWRNGKRFTSPMLEEQPIHSVTHNLAQLDTSLGNCELQKLRLLLQGNDNNRMLQVPCETPEAFPKRNFAEPNGNDHFHRQPVLTNNNY